MDDPLRDLLFGIAEAGNDLKDQVFAIRKILIDKGIVSQAEYDALVEQIHGQTHPLNADLERMMGLDSPRPDEQNT